MRNKIIKRRELIILPELSKNKKSYKDLCQPVISLKEDKRYFNIAHDIILEELTRNMNATNETNLLRAIQYLMTKKITSKNLSKEVNKALGKLYGIK